ncbi:MAG: hypothetical protein ACHQWU_02735 [Gemmatimonadales bacterium]
MRDNIAYGLHDATDAEVEDAAHRLSTIRRADIILLMEDGRILERGSHDDLMARRGTYYDMVLRQMQSFSQNVEPVFS